VSASAFDTLRAAKRLKDLGFTEVQAEGVAEVLRDAREVDFSQLATKADLSQLATKVEIAQLATKAEVSQLATKAEIAQLATKAEVSQLATKAELAEAKYDLIKWMAGFGIAQLGGLVGVAYAILKLFPGGHP
jgi:glutamate racemase